jgi:hypothetical protein
MLATRPSRRPKVGVRERSTLSDTTHILDRAAIAVKIRTQFVLHARVLGFDMVGRLR